MDFQLTTEAKESRKAKTPHLRQSFSNCTTTGYRVLLALPRQGFPFQMCTVGVDWQPLTNHRTVANFCIPAPRRSCKTRHALQIWLRSRRTLCFPVCTPAPLVKKHQGGRIGEPQPGPRVRGEGSVKRTGATKRILRPSPGERSPPNKGRRECETDRVRRK